MNLLIKRIDKTIPLSKYAHEGDAGLDLYASHDCVIPSKDKQVISTGIAMKIPKGYVGLIWDRSGLAAKHFLHNVGGVIDSGYRGEIKVLVSNFSDEDYEVKKGDRISQILIQPVQTCNVLEVEELDSTTRGQKHFGSSGK